MRIQIKPLSINQAWQGKRYKTDEYTAYQKELLFRLPKMDIPAGNLHIFYRVGFSNKNSDLGNMEKPFTDILCKKYGFDDRDVYKFTMVKEIVPKGKEFIEFEIKKYVPEDYMF